MNQSSHEGQQNQSLKSSDQANLFLRTDAYHIIQEKDRKLKQYKYLYTSTKQLYDEILTHTIAKSAKKISIQSADKFFNLLIKKVVNTYIQFEIPKKKYESYINQFLDDYRSFVDSIKKEPSNTTTETL
jgi:hypothetical protein